MCRLLLVALAVMLGIGTTAPAVAQPEPGHFVVLTRNASPPRSRLLAIDPANGAMRPLPRFTEDGLEPDGVEVDPVNGDVLVALHDPASPTVRSLWRLRPGAGAWQRTRRLGAAPDPVTGLVFGPSGDLFSVSTAGAAGQLSGHARMHASTRTVRALAGPTAFDPLPSGGFSGYAFVAEIGAGVPQITMLEVPTGRAVHGPFALPALAGRVVTSVHDLPTGVFRQAITDDAGAVHLFEGFSSLRSIPVTPAWPAGGAVAAVGAGHELVVLGGAAHPYLKQVVVFGSNAGQWTTIAGPLPGDPVDVAQVAPGGMRLLRFGSSSAGGGSVTTSGSPQLVTTSFVVGVDRAAASSPAHLLLGIDDMAYGSLPLPVTLPGGASLLVSAEVVLTTSTSAAGSAALTVPIPNQTVLVGRQVFAQWLTGSLTSLGGSAALAIRIGP